MSNLLISTDFVADYFQLSKNIDRLALERAIREVQDIDLPEKICDDYLIEIMARPGDFGPVLNENTWEVNGRRFFHRGLKLAMAYLAAGRYLISKEGTDTPFGFVEKRTDWSSEVEPERRRRLGEQYRATGQKYLARVVDFLSDTDFQNFSLYCPALCVSDNEFRTWKIDVISGSDE
jgi:hypothetical protein